MKCKACSEDIHQEDLLLCAGVCGGNFHFTCCGFTDKAFRKYLADKKKKWICITCNQSLSDASNKPKMPETVKSVTNINLNPTANKPEDDEPVNSEMNINLNPEIMSFIEKLVSKKVSDRLDEFKRSLDYNDADILELKNSVKTLAESNKKLQSENKRITEENLLLKKDVKDLKLAVIELKQYSRRANMEVSDIPESENENIEQYLSKMGELAGCDVLNNVVIAHRVPSFNKERPKSIIVQFKSKPVKDQIQKKLKERKITSSELNPRLADMPVYFNEHLTPELKKVFYLARNFKKVNNFKFCWVRDGKIYVRKNETSKIYRIQTEEDLNGVLSD